jgi:hypothetical protein
MQSFIAEYSRNIGYSFFLRAKDVGTSVSLTPAPMALFIQIKESVFKINMLHSILSLENVLVQSEEEWIYIRIPVIENNEHELRFKREVLDGNSSVFCKHCGKNLVAGFEQCFPMPSTNWETLSELWSCHPSHEPAFSLNIKGKICYSSLFYYHFQAENLELSFYVQENKVCCQNCHTYVGIAKEEIMLFRHRTVMQTEENLHSLIEDALCERINESEKDIFLGDLQIRLLKWDSFIYSNNEFKPCMKVLYCDSLIKGFELPTEDLSAIRKSLEKFNKKLPKNAKKIGDMRISFFLTS